MRLTIDMKLFVFTVVERQNLALLGSFLTSNVRVQ